MFYLDRHSECQETQQVTKENDQKLFLSLHELLENSEYVEE